MRHLLLSEQWFPQIGGSIHLFDAIYCQHFPPEERVHVLAAHMPGDPVVDATFPTPVTRFQAQRYGWMRPESLFAYVRMAASAARLVMTEHIDVVHCARVIPEGVVGMLIERVFGIPYVVWVHGEEVSMYLRYDVKSALMPEIFRHARAVICNSSFSRAQAHSAGAPTERLQVVHPCVDHRRFENPLDTTPLIRRFGLAGKTVLLSVGRLTRRKGHDFVLRALARLGRTDIAYLILSDGELEPELHALARDLRLEDVVRFVGPVPAHELPLYYAASDVFVMPNRVLPDGDVEGFGLVFLEASASGIPVIGGRSGGVVDAVADGESGWLVDGSSVADIAQAIERLVDNPVLRRQLGERGREIARRRFSWPEAAARVRDIAAGAPADHRSRASTPPKPLLVGAQDR